MGQVAAAQRVFQLAQEMVEQPVPRLAQVAQAWPPPQLAYRYPAPFVQASDLCALLVYQRLREGGRQHLVLEVGFASSLPRALLELALLGEELPLEARLADRSHPRQLRVVGCRLGDHLGLARARQ